MNSYNDPHRHQPVEYAGTDLESASAVMIALHGRGASPADILLLGEQFRQPGLAIIAPRAANHTWYPYSFLTPKDKNEPHLSSALGKIHTIVEEILGHGFKTGQIFLLGFSQGACLALEYAARNPQKYGGVFGLSGGLIGSSISLDDYSGDLESTPVFLGCSDRDPHIPLERVNESGEILGALHARVEKRIYPGMPHTVNEDEIDYINSCLNDRDN